MTDEFGPWIEHDGRRMPVPAGTVVEAECENVTGMIVRVTKVAGSTAGFSWNWRNFGVRTAWRALRYRLMREVWPEFDDWNERAAIMEYDGGMDRAEAEAAAYDDVMREDGHAHLRAA